MGVDEMKVAVGVGLGEILLRGGNQSLDLLKPQVFKAVVRIVDILIENQVAVFPVSQGCVLVVQGLRRKLERVLFPVALLLEIVKNLSRVGQVVSVVKVPI